MALDLVVHRVQHDGTHRQVALLHGVPVRSRFQFCRFGAAIDEVIGAPPGWFEGQKPILIEPHGRSGYLHTAVGGEVWHVYVDEMALIPEVHQFLDVAREKGTDRLKMEGCVKAVQGDGDSRDLLVRCLARSGTGSGIDDIRPQVCPDIDTRDDQVRHDGDRSEGGKNDAVGGGSADRVGTLPHPGATDRLREGDAVGEAAPLTVGRDNPYLVILRKGLFQGFQAGTEDSIVVG